MTPMPEAIPTPFDIIAIPYMAWVPSAPAWIATLVCVAALMLLAWLVQRPRSHSYDEGKILSTLLKDLKLLTTQRGALYQERSLHLVTRVVCTIKGHSWAALSASELRQRCATCADDLERKIITCLADLHETLCQPDRDGRQERVDGLLAELVRSLTAILRERKGI
jgi:membrane protein implicated in regulation of membrane protease activity